MEKEANNLLTGNVTIPKSSAWGFVFSAIIIVVTAYMTLNTRIVSIEKDIVFLQRDVLKNETAAETQTTTVRYASKNSNKNRKFGYDY